MANDDRERREPSLEPPSLGFSRRRRRKQQEPPGQEQPSSSGEAGASPRPTPSSEGAGEPTEVLPPVVPPSGRASAAPSPSAATPPTSLGATPPGATPPGATPPGATSPGLTPPAPARPAAPAAPEPVATRTAVQPSPGRDAVDERPPRAPRTPPLTGQLTGQRTGLLTGMAAAVFTGAFVGLLLVGATGGSLRVCEAVRGTSSCGDPGFFLLLAILVAGVLAGGLLLRALGVSDPMSTSFLGVGLLTVVALVFLVDVLFAGSMVLVIPLCGAATFALSHWVTRTFVEPADR